MSEPDFSKKAAGAQTSAASSRPDMTGISVILPNFNHAAFLPAALLALARQRPAPNEIIVIDDASTDDSIAVIAAHAKLIPQLKLLRHQTNRGAIAALNTGLEAASFPYICFAAADDITFDGLFENLLPMLIANPQAAFCSAECVVTDQNGNHIGFRPVARPSQTASCFTPAETQVLLR
ncbi:MAG: glycosyltransferase family 2 protein, partial [Bosea sp. (in: a-proteobacteria)]